MASFDHPATITRLERPTEHTLLLECTTEEQVPFIAGQYLSIVPPGGKPAPFSIASSPVAVGGPTRFEFAIGCTGGRTTGQLTQMHIGDALTLRGPFGKFFLGNEPRICLLAGGLGVTPLMSMLRHIRDSGAAIDATLMWSCKTPQQFLWMPELDEATVTHQNLRIVRTITDAASADATWNGPVGRIDEAMLREAMPDIVERVTYLCGPKPFIEGMVALLRSLGVPDERIRKESW
jgi:ferredoxin-NADP reductase